VSAPPGAFSRVTAMAQRVEGFIHKTGVTAAIFNLFLNPLFAWLGNMALADVPLTGIAVDTAITCILMSLLVALFISAETRRALGAGILETAGHPRTRAAHLLRHLPDRPWKLGLLLGLVAAALVTPCLVGLFSVFGVTSLSFFAFALLKAVYTPLLAYAVARWVILRQLAAVVA
jgi:hypothetical protein